MSKNDRHLQLINSSVFHEQTQARNKAIEETRLHKQRQKDARERNQLINHFNRVANPSVVPANQASAPSYEVNVGGIRFQVTKNGSKLTKLPGASPLPSSIFHVAYSVEGDMNSPKATPKMAIVGGIKFYRSKNGNLYRQGIVRAQRYVTRPRTDLLLTPGPPRRYGGVKKVDVPCKSFSTTGIFLSIPRILSRNKYVARLGHGTYSNSTDQYNLCLGSCPKGPMCRYVHDPSKVAACKDLLLKGVCASGDSCDLSHQLIPERTPHCVHYAKGNCSNPNCPYTHRVLPSGAPFCRPFGIDGYCEKGISCPGRHSFECPDFSNTGVCKTRGCKLLHRERANFIRKANAAREQASTANDDVDDVSSDDDGESVNSNDVDSEGVEDFMGKEELLGFASQKDFIQF